MRSRSGRRRNWPDLSAFDLWKPFDLEACHELLAAEGFADDEYDGLRRTVLAAVLARRLATTNAHGYLAKIVREGFSRFGPADRDHDETKAIMRRLFYRQLTIGGNENEWAE